MKRKSRDSIKEPITIRLSPESKQKLRELASAENRTISSLIDIAVEQFLNPGGSDIEPTVDEWGIAEITLLLQIQRLREIGSEKYRDELKAFAETLNIPDEAMYKVWVAVLEGTWHQRQ